MTIELLILLIGTGLLTGLGVSWLQPAAERWSYLHDKDM
jgi:hypothetical protein